MKDIKLCHCGAPVGSRRKDAQYCSEKCKREAFYQRQQSTITNSPFLPIQGKSQAKVYVFSKEELAIQAELRKYELDLQFKIRLQELDQQKEAQNLKAQELMLSKAKFEEEAKIKQQAEARRTIWEPIKSEVNNCLKEIIDNGHDCTWDVEDLKDYIASIRRLILKVQNFKSDSFVVGDSFCSYLNDILYPALLYLHKELKSVFRDRSCYTETRNEIVVDFTKSYIKELSIIKQRLVNS